MTAVCCATSATTLAAGDITGLSAYEAIASVLTPIGPGGPVSISTREPAPPTGAAKQCDQCGPLYVLPPRTNDTVATVDWRQRRVRALIAEVPAEAWQQCSAGAGAHGLRLYDWARLEPLAGFDSGWARWLLARRTWAGIPASITCCSMRRPAHARLGSQSSPMPAARVGYRSSSRLSVGSCNGRSALIWSAWRRSEGRRCGSPRSPPLST